jgi:uncharacterized protein with ParB-like and HNH nuclease domain
MESLLKELEEAKNCIPLMDRMMMSIGELRSLYETGKLKLNIFQRKSIWRSWSDQQKTNFIESLLLGIPNAPICVTQDVDGHWMLIDGMLRMSAIFELMGLLPDCPVLSLEKSNYLPSLEGQTWKTLPSKARALIQKSDFAVVIFLAETKEEQFKLYQRLNARA